MIKMNSFCFLIRGRMSCINDNLFFQLLTGKKLLCHLNHELITVQNDQNGTFHHSVHLRRTQLILKQSAFLEFL